MLMKLNPRDLNNTFSWMDDFRREFDFLMGGNPLALFNLSDRLSPYGLYPFRGGAPQIEAFDNASQTGFRLEIPGIPREAVQITVEEGALLLKGQREVTPPEGYEIRGQERSAFEFEHRLTIPANAQPNSGRASLENGVLEVVFDKQPKPEARKIEIV